MIDPLALPPSVLANDHIVQAELLHALQHLHLLIADVLSIQAHLHASRQAEVLKQRCQGSVHQGHASWLFCHRKKELRLKLDGDLNLRPLKEH